MREERFSFTGLTSELGVLRAKLTELLRAEGWTDEEMAEVLLAAGELATNAVMHAQTPFEVRCLVDGHVELEVADRDAQHLPRMRPFDGRSGGYGLHIVDQLARHWGVEQQADTKTVRAVLDRGSIPSSSSLIGVAGRDGGDPSVSPGRAKGVLRSPPKLTAYSTAQPGRTGGG